MEKYHKPAVALANVDVVPLRTGGEDFEITVRQVVLLPNVTQTSVSIRVFDDDLLEGREEFGVRLVAGEGVMVREGEARVEIVDEDGKW